MEEHDQNTYELRFRAFQLSANRINLPGRIKVYPFSVNSFSLSEVVPVISCGMEKVFPERLVYAGGVLFRSVELYEDGELCPLWYGLQLGMYREDFQVLIDQLKKKMEELKV